MAIKFIRKFVERLSRDRIIRRRLPKEFNSREIYVSPDSSLQYWKRDLSGIAPELFEIARKLVRPQDVVWDIGANVGLFSFAAAAKVGPSGQVLAVEPDPWLGSLLRRSAEVSFSDAAAVKVLSAAVSESLGIAEFNIASRGRSSNFVSGYGSTQRGGSRGSFPVITVTLDWLMDYFGAPTLIKIDIEGMELAALRGASRLLQLRPTLIMEATDKNNSDIFAMLTTNRYQLLETDLQTVINADRAAHLPPNIVAMAA
jgi:FkbM family methyltransferase